MATNYSVGPLEPLTAMGFLCAYIFFTPRCACAARGKVIALGLMSAMNLSKYSDTFRSPFQHR